MKKQNSSSWNTVTQLMEKVIGLNVA